MAKTELKLCLGAPSRVDGRSGHLWFPTLHPLGGEGVLCIAAVTSDRPQGVWPAAAYWSRDSGSSWQKVPEVIHYALASILIKPGDLLLLPYELAPASCVDHCSATAQGTRLILKDSGTVTATPQQVQFDNFPRDIAIHSHGGLRMVTGGNVLGLADGSLFTTLYGRFIGEERYSLLGMVSHDNGYHWSFRAQLADGWDLPNSPEGPSESATITGTDGRLLCLYRVGSGAGRSYYRSESTDDGYHWSSPRPVLCVGSVKPQLISLENGTLLLTGGRPGLTLWISHDDGLVWRSFDLVAHHNATMSDPTQYFKEPSAKPSITTSYSALCPLGPKTALVCYDRLGNGWGGGSWSPWN
ncbi:Sialidase domain-containing protein [Gammaproteobacteria bacterium]